jgi:hypothetical protein
VTKVKEHRGRIVKTTGDGLLIEFASVVDAVRCPVDVKTVGRELGVRYILEGSLRKSDSRHSRHCAAHRGRDRQACLG